MYAYAVIIGSDILKLNAINITNICDPQKTSLTINQKSTWTKKRSEVDMEYQLFL